MEIAEWQALFVKEAKRKFPAEWTVEQRLLSLHRQIADISQTLQSGERNGIRLQTRVADILPDVFLLADQLGVDLEKELSGEILAFFRK